MNEVRRGVARLLTPTQRNWIWTKLLRARQVGSRLAGMVFRLVPPYVYLSVRDGYSLVRYLDYPKSPIRMGVESFAELDRLRSCRKEPETIDWLSAHLKRGDILYDIGANVGAYSLVASTLADGGCVVYAFEPSYSSFGSLSRNILLNQCQDRVFPFAVALTSETRLTFLEFSSTSPGAALHTLRGQIAPNRHSLPAMGYRLDDFAECLGLPMPNLIKLDVDGYELDVLLGSNSVLSSTSLRSVLVEVDEADEGSRAVHLHLEERGFRLASVHPHNLSSVANRIYSRTTP